MIFPVFIETDKKTTIIHYIAYISTTIKIRRKVMKRKIFLLAASLFTLTAISSSLNATEIKADDPAIKYEGVLYREKRNDEGIEYRRFLIPLLKKGLPKFKLAKFEKGQVKSLTTPCIKMFFKTDAKSVTAHFKMLKGATDRGSNFALYRNGKFWKEARFSKSKTYPKDLEIELTPEKGAKETLYQISFPSWSNPFFYGLTTDGDSKLIPFELPKKKIYVAYGDSVSHGTGQKSAAYLTWPYKLAEKINYEVYSLAIGGAKINRNLFPMFKEFKHIDLITVYIGINDAGAKTLKEYGDDYNALLDAIRASHPETKIVCISMHTLPKDKKGKKDGTPLREYGEVAKEIVKKRVAAGDKKLMLVDGTELVGLEDAMNPGNVHLSIAGADKWAKNLYKKIEGFVSKCY